MTPISQSRPSLRAQAEALVRQMDWFRGLRAAIALCAPMLLGDLAGLPNQGWTALGGFEAIIADNGGPYRSRLENLALLTFGGAAGVFLGSVAGASLGWALPTTLLFCFLWSYLAALGQPFSSAGVLVQVIFICGIGAPTASWHEALTRALLLMAGGTWAALLSLLLWPLDAYRPARTAVSDCYTELASFLASISSLAERQKQSAGLWHRLATHHQYRLRRAIEHGWHALASIRAKRQADTPQGRQLVVLLEHVDLLLAGTVAMAEHLEAQAADSPCRQRSLAGLADLRSVELWVASLLVRRQSLTADHARAERSRMRRLPGYLEECLAHGDNAARALIGQIGNAASVMESSVDSATQLRLGRSPDPVPAPTREVSASHFAHVYARLAGQERDWSLGRILDQLTANFTGKSLMLRHAARVALVCGFDVALIFLLNIDHGYWLLLTSLIVLQPHVSGTLRRGLERVGGTVAGGILAAVLAAALHSQLVIAAVLFPLALLALAILPVSYGAFAFFLTPTFVLAWLPYSGDWQLALVRTLNTIAGAFISIVAMLFLFPAYERERAPQFLRASLAADRRYLAELVASWSSHARSSRLLANARRAAGLAHNDTEESLERMLAESWPRRQPFAQFVTAFVTYLRRVAQSVTTLAALQGEWEWKRSAAIQGRLALLDRRLAWIETQVTVRPHSATDAWPETTVPSLPAELLAQEHPGERQMDRLERQVEILHRQLHSLREHGWLPGVAKP
jgi:uncharacterized membrane protein YccC